MSKTWQMSRRTVLRGLGTAVALPLLDAMAPAVQAAAKKGVKIPPKRMAFIFAPNGKMMNDWTPKTEGRDFELPRLLEPLASVRDYVNVLTGLTHDNGRAKGDGPGDHARSAGPFLTGSHPYKTGGANIRLGQSVDQAAAEKLGQETPLPSLELGCERGRNAGSCDSGYSCAYSHNISWRTEYAPMAKEINPHAVFERLFGGRNAGEQNAGRAKRSRYNKSVLDFVMDDANRLRPRLGSNDKRKLDEYFTSVREIEVRMGRWNRTEDPDFDPEIEVPEERPKDYTEHIQLMYDLMALAFQADVTRVITFMVGNAGSNRSYRMVDVREGHHSLSHHRNDDAKMEQIRRINEFHTRQLARFLEKLRSIEEGEGNLLDNAMIVYGSGLADGNRHEHHSLPLLLAGRGGGTIDTGRHIRYPNETPMTNLFLSMLDRVGVEKESFGDSTGRLKGLST